MSLFPDNPKHIWESKLDTHYNCVVERVDGDAYKGRFTITDLRDDSIVLDEIVTVSYGAVFGVDGADMWAWENRGIEVVDAL